MKFDASRTILCFEPGDWSEYVKYLDGTYWSAAYVYEEYPTFYRVLTEGVAGFRYEITINKDGGAAQTTFEATYKNQHPRFPSVSTTTPVTAPTAVRLSTGSVYYDGVQSGQLPASLVEGRLDANLGSWLGSTAPTVGQKTSSASLPVVLASDQTLNTVTGNTTATGTLGSLNAAVTVALVGQQSVGFQLAAGTLRGTIVPECSVDNGITWVQTFFDNPTTGAKTASEVFSSNNGAITRGICGVGGATHVRVRVSAYTSGTAGGTLTAVQFSRQAFLSEGPVCDTVPEVAQLVGGSDGTTLRSLRVAEDRSLVTRPAEIATFTVLATGTTVINNKSLLSIMNGVGSSVILKVMSIYIVNVQSTAVTGIVGTFELRRITGHSSGTTITAIEELDTSDSLDGDVSVKTGATVSGESSKLLWRSVFSTDEWASGSLDNEAHEHIFQTMFPVWSRPERNSKHLTLKAGEGLTVKFATSSSVGTFDVMVVLGQE